MKNLSNIQEYDFLVFKHNIKQPNFKRTNVMLQVHKMFKITPIGTFLEKCKFCYCPGSRGKIKCHSPVTGGNFLVIFLVVGLLNMMQVQGGGGWLHSL